MSPVEDNGGNTANSGVVRIPRNRPLPPRGPWQHDKYEDALGN